MYRKILPIAINTFREAVRDKVFYSILAFAVGMVLFSVLLGKLSLGETYKIVQDFSLAATSLFGALVTAFVGISLVYKEIEKKTIYNLLSKPISRRQFIIGKYIGLSMVLGLMVIGMAIILFVVCYFISGDIPFVDLYAFFMIFLELETLLALAILFSTFSTPFMSGMFTLALFIIGQVSQDLYDIYDSVSSSGLSAIIKGVYYLLPNYAILDYKSDVVHLVSINMDDYCKSILYAFLYLIIVLQFAILIFEHRDMK